MRSEQNYHLSLSHIRLEKNMAMRIIRFGFVIVDNTKRGYGYGKQLLRQAIEYAREKLGAKQITLGVFCENISAVECYKSVGFRIIGDGSYLIDGDEWKEFEMEL